MYFWETYPSPEHLKDKTAEELYEEFRNVARNVSISKAELILECIQNDGNTRREYQETRDFITQSLMKDIGHQRLVLRQTEAEIEKMLKTFDRQLTTLPGVGTVVAAKLITEIGDISRFKNSDKLVAFAGVSPKSFSSGGTGHDESNKQGERKLHSLFYFLAAGMVCVQKDAGKTRGQVRCLMVKGKENFLDRKERDGGTGTLS